MGGGAAPVAARDVHCAAVAAAAAADAAVRLDAAAHAGRHAEHDGAADDQHGQWAGEQCGRFGDVHVARVHRPLRSVCPGGGTARRGLLS